MSRDYNITLAGFGGQGILFAGKLIAYAGMLEGREVSWLPSYGPEMRGGTANCSVCLSDAAIGSPLVINPDVLVAMNLPSFEKFIDDVVPGGLVIVDKSMVEVCPMRTDVEFVALPATQLAEDNELKGLANVILVGKLLSLTNFAPEEYLDLAIDKSVSAKREALKVSNKQALKIGRDWVAPSGCER
jgi:2-oxoglutarate ferredoxin oxidoreductase subunit gamma